MAKNEQFHTQFVIEASGRSTNQFVPKLIEKMLKGMVSSINRMYQQTDAVLTMTDLRKGKK